MVSRCRALPARPVVQPDEALDSYLVRLAHANSLTAREVSDEITHHSGVRLVNGRAAITGCTPIAEVVATVADLTNLSPPDVITTTLARYLATDVGPGPGSHVPWPPTVGTLICPECVRTHHYWQLSWRLPQVAVCLEHGILLQHHCPRCGRPFRSRRRPPLPDTLTHCDNVMVGADGTRQPCDFPLASLARQPASGSQRATAAFLGAVTADTVDVRICGHPVGATDYLANHYGVVLLLSHLISVGNARDRPWTPAVVADVDGRSATKPRRSRSLCTDMSARAELLAVAADILGAPTLDEAAIRLLPYAQHVPSRSAGPRAWLISNTHRTPTIEQLTRQLVAPQRSLSYQLDHTVEPTRLRPHAIPQAIPADLYDTHFRGAFAVTPDTGRIFVSL